MFSDIFDFRLISCIASEGGAVDENIDDDAPIVVEMNKQFSSPGSVVNLSGQDLSDWVSMQSLCARLSRSDNAKSIIYLDHCNLGRHGAAIVSRSFTHVLIRAGNYVAKWLPLMNQNGRILVLSMINNDIGSDGAAAVSKMLRVNTGLRELNLRFNEIGPDGAQYLASALYVNDGLRFICLSCNELCGIDTVGDGNYDLTGFSALMRALQVNTKIRTVKLAENDIGNDGGKYVADVLSENRRISVLDLHGNALFATVETVASCQKSLKTADELSNIGSVSVSISSCQDGEDEVGNSMHSSDKDDTASAVASVMDELLYMVQENFESDRPSDFDNIVNMHNELTKQGGYELLQCLGETSTLSSVDVSWNGLGPNGVDILISSILSNRTTSLTYLDLHGNPLEDSGIFYLSRLLGDKQFCKISTLNLQFTGMGPLGASYFGAALASNASLTKVNISSNQIEALGSEKISLGLRFNNSITDLNLRHCRLCSEGIAHIANMLQYNKSLVNLNLSSNNIDDDGATSLAATIAINKSLQTLDLSNYVKTFSCSALDSISNTSSNSNVKSKITFQKPASPTKQSTLSDSGVEVLALSIRSNQVHLKKLVLKGHWLTPKSEEEVLSAMDKRRICYIEASFPTLEQKHQMIVETMKSEREILTSCYTPNFLRVHVCGQDSEAKLSMIKGWCNCRKQENGSFYSKIFAQNPLRIDVPGVCKSTILLDEQRNILKNTVDPLIEVGLWSYQGGHDCHNIFRLHLRSSPLGAAIVCASVVGKDGQCRSSSDIAKELYSWISLLLTYGHHSRDIMVVFTSGAQFDKAWHGLSSLLSNHKVAHSMSDSSLCKLDPSHENEIDESEKSSLPNDSFHSISLKSEALDKSMSIYSDCHNVHTVDDGPERNCLNSILEQSLHSKLGDAAKEISSHNSEMRRKFEANIKEILADMLSASHVPQHFVWEEGRSTTPMHSRVETWLRERYKSLSKHVRIPSICKILREKCLPPLLAAGIKVIDINELLSEGQKHIRCLQNLELRHACQWLHQLGDIFVVDVTMETDIAVDLTERKTLPGNDDTRKDNKLFKIILDPSWFSEAVLLPIVGHSVSLSFEQQCNQPWGNKEYLLSSQHFLDFTSPLTKLGLTRRELLSVLEHFRIGVVLNCRNIKENVNTIVFATPSRIGESKKLEWLRHRGVARIPLSQSSNDTPAITAVLGRRVRPRKPYIVPPSFFSCIQSEVLYNCERGRKRYRAMCWENGMGVVFDDCNDSSVIRGSVCGLLECTPKWDHNSWSQDPGCAVDVMVWSEGQCSISGVRQMLSFLLLIVQKAGEIVINGTLRLSEAQEKDRRVDYLYTPTIPIINWSKVTFLRPGCVLHTLASSTADRSCGEYIDDDASDVPKSSPVLVSCHHPQPRLNMGHLRNGYVLSESPGGGKGMLRSIRGSLAALEGDEAASGKGQGVYEHAFVEFYPDSTVASE